MKPTEILLIEDNAGDILLIRQALAHTTIPTSVHVAVDGKQAIQMLMERQFDPDLVILDLNIPKVSGLSLLERSHIPAPVVVFTSSSSPEDRFQALALGAKDYVQKPTDLGEYGRQVSKIVGSWGDFKTAKGIRPVTPSPTRSSVPSMAQCSYCGAETQLHVNDRPVCRACVEDLEKSEKPPPKRPDHSGQGQ